jgi:death-on-curing family protein
VLQIGDLCFLEVSDVLVLHRDAVEKTREPRTILSEPLLDSAVTSIQTAYFYGVTDHFELAAKYAFSIAKAHAFKQGNKRTGLAAALTFLAKQGHPIGGYSSIVLALGVLGLVENFICSELFAEYLKHPTLGRSRGIISKWLRYALCRLPIKISEFIQRTWRTRRKTQRKTD